CTRLEGDSCRRLLPRRDDCAAAGLGPSSSYPALDSVGDRSSRRGRPELSPTIGLKTKGSPFGFFWGGFYSVPNETNGLARVHETARFPQGGSRPSCVQELGRGAACRDQRMGNDSRNRPLLHIEGHYASNTHRARQPRYCCCADKRSHPRGAPAKCSARVY